MCPPTPHGTLGISTWRIFVQYRLLPFARGGLAHSASRRGEDVGHADSFHRLGPRPCGLVKPTGGARPHSVAPHPGAHDFRPIGPRCFGLPVRPLGECGGRFHPPRRSLNSGGPRPRSRHSSVMLRPVSAYRRIRILSSVEYLLPFMVWGPGLRPRLSPKAAQKSEVTSQPLME